MPVLNEVNITDEGEIMYRTFFVVAVILVSAMLTACASNPNVKSGSIAVGNEDMSAVLVFGDSDRQRIKHYYNSGKKSKKMPPGLAKKQELPPGLQKHIRKHGELPPGLTGRRLPLELERNLSRLPEGYVRMKVGGDMVLMNEITRVVFDVIWGID